MNTRAELALKAIVDARDYHAEHGHYPAHLLASDQSFDDWAADLAQKALNSEPIKFTKEYREKMKRACRSILDNEGINPKNTRGKHFAAMFWLGALNMQNTLFGQTDPGATILLTCGRVEELIAEEAS